jgi:hypothetical protein
MGIEDQRVGCSTVDVLDAADDVDRTPSVLQPTVDRRADVMARR